MNSMIQEIFRGAAGRHAGAVAIECGDRSVSYQWLDRESDRLASFLLAGGAGAGTIVTILTSDIVASAVAVIGVLKAGAVFVPLDRAFPDARLDLLMSQVRPEWMIADRGALAQAAAAIARHPRRVPVICLDSAPGAGNGLDPEIASGIERYREFSCASAPAVEYDPDQICYIYFTSGSTGVPKGIAGRLKSIGHFIGWEIETFGIVPGTRVSQLTTPSFDAFLRDLFVPLCAGGTVCAPPSRDLLLDARRLAGWIDRSGINLVHTVPSLFRALLGAGLDGAMFPHLRQILLAGEPLLPADVRRWRDCFGDRIELVNLYGPSETTMTKLFHRVKPGDELRRSIPVGTPMQGARALIVDARGRPVPAGTIGEIYIRTPFCSLGYYRQPELTDAVFFRNPASDDPHDLIYRTGDMGRVLNDGLIEVLGRRDLQVKIRGVRVELQEIEDAMMSAPGVRDAVVVSREDSAGGGYLCAYAVFDGGGEESVRTGILREHLAARLPEWMIPSLIMPIAELPRTVTGKVDRRGLPVPELVHTAGSGEFVAPHTPLEEELGAIWRKVLRLERIGTDDDFFRLGGHSLLATQLLARVYDALGVEVPLQRLLEHPTVAGLAESIESIRNGGARPRPIRASQHHGDLPLSFMQQRLWMLEQLYPGITPYAMPVGVRLHGALDAVLLEECLNRVVQRHDALRATFAASGGEGVARIRSHVPVRLAVADLEAAASPESEVRSLAEAEARMPFDLEQGPLIRAVLLRLGEAEHHLLITLHHIIADGWSIGILIREMGALYQSLLRGDASPLPELPVRYGDYVLWQREMFMAEGARDLAYWRERLEGAPPLLEIPGARPRSATRSFNGARVDFEIPPELAGALRNLSRQEGVSLFVLLLAAFKALLYRYSGQEDIVIGTPVANRHRSELEGVIGLFADVLVLRSDLEGDPSFRELAGRIGRGMLESYEHRNVPFERLVEAASQRRIAGANPVYQIMFGLEEEAHAEMTIGELRMTPAEAGGDRAKMDLFCAVVPSAEGMRGTFEYSTDLFDAQMIERMAGHFLALLASAAADPSTRLSRLSMMSRQEREHLVASASAASPVHHLPGEIRARLERAASQLQGRG